MAQKLSAAQIAAHARQAGFTGPMVPIMTAIAMAESGGVPTAFNGNASTGDRSFGLWQINMLGSMGPSRRKALGITSDEQLKDPATNARAAFMIWKSQGLGAWSVYKHGTYSKYLPEASTASAKNEAVDPAQLAAIGAGPGGGGTTTAPAGDQGDGSSNPLDALKWIGRTAVWLANPHNILRVAQGVVGGGLVLGGALLLARPVVAPVVGQVAAVATPVGRVATVAKKAGQQLGGAA